MLAQSSEREAVLAYRASGSAATMYRAALIARVGKISTAGYPR